jgi:hypothetical protein
MIKSYNGLRLMSFCKIVVLAAFMALASHTMQAKEQGTVQNTPIEQLSGDDKL